MSSDTQAPKIIGRKLRVVSNGARDIKFFDAETNAPLDLRVSSADWHIGAGDGVRLSLSFYKANIDVVAEIGEAKMVDGAKIVEFDSSRYLVKVLEHEGKGRVCFIDRESLKARKCQSCFMTRSNNASPSNGKSSQCGSDRYSVVESNIEDYR